MRRIYWSHERTLESACLNTEGIPLICDHAFNPKPSQKPHPPIYFGGESDAALGRVATLGDGWYAYDISPEELALRLDLLHNKMQQAGRSLDEMELIVGPNRHPVNEKTIEQYSSWG